MAAPVPVAPGVFLVRDTCNVYVVVADPDDDARARPGAPRTAVCIDFGSGEVLSHLAAMGVDRITDVLLTHHHRDQAQGLPDAVAAGIAVHVPPVERDLVDGVEDVWRSRPVALDYSLRQDRFSILEPVPVTATVPEYREAEYPGVVVRTLPTPGHTTGSVTYLVERGGGRLAFTGDLICAPGRVWSLAATQWSYSDNEGPAMTVLSCLLLAREHPDLLLPSHGEPMPDAVGALVLLADRMQAYVDSRRPVPWDLRGRLDDPFVRVTEHLLHNRSSVATTYVLLSRTGAALFFDYGYDMTTGLPPGSDRASRRPWLASLPALRRRYGVERVEVALATHYHDDHVAGLNLLREVEGTQVWVPENVAPVLADPLRHDLPCQWFDPVEADRVLPMGGTVRWHEYEITVHELRGHTRYAAAFEVEVDGVRVLVTGDQQDGRGVAGERREVLNYQYRNRFDADDFSGSAALYRRVAPGLMLSGHWAPRRVDDEYLDLLAAQGAEVARLHRALLPEGLDLGTDGVCARVTPYLSRVEPDAKLELTVAVRNPHPGPTTAHLDPVVPAGWRVEPEGAEVALAVGEEASASFVVVVGGPVRRARLAVDVTVGDLRLGQHAEALVDVSAPAPAREGAR